MISLSRREFVSQISQVPLIEGNLRAKGIGVSLRNCGKTSVPGGGASPSGQVQSHCRVQNPDDYGALFSFWRSVPITVILNPKISSLSSKTPLISTLR